MANNDLGRKSFLFYYSWKEQIELLNDEELRRFINNCINFHTGEEIILETTSDKLVWNSVKIALEINHKKYLGRVEANRKNGQLGGRPRNDEKPKKPNGFPENPENLIIDNGKEVKENREEIIDDSKKGIVNSKETIENRRLENVNRELTSEKIQELIEDSKKLKEYLDTRVGGILIYDNSIHERYNPDNIGEDIADDNRIQSFLIRIKDIWNTNTKLSKKIEDLTTIGSSVFSLIAPKFTYDNIILMNSNEYNNLPQFYLTRNNLKLYQLFHNIECFVEDIKIIQNEMEQSTV